MEHDLVIRNGTVVDGSGLAPYRADVGVAGGRIVTLGRIRDRGREEVDAEGQVVTPGFVDGHTHMDAQVFWDELGSCSCWHGVTTVVMGNCGFSLAPSRPGETGLVVRNLERAEDISGPAMAAGIDWSWETFPEYLDAVDRQPKAINYAAQIGHSALRTWAMGERAFEQGATEEDLKLMSRELEAALRAGAIGFTTSRSEFHETSDDRPVASRQASWDEVVRLVNVLGDVGSGVFESAFGPAARAADPVERESVLGPLRDLALSTGVPFTFGVVATDGGMHPLVELIDQTVAAGGRMFGQSNSRGVALVYSFETTLPCDALPAWAELRALPLDAQAAALRDPEVKRRLVEAVPSATVALLGRLQVLDTVVPPHPVLSDVATARNTDPVTALIDLAMESGLHQLFVQPATSIDEGSLLAHMRHPRLVMTFSDSGAHVSQIMDSSIQTHLLAYWVRQKQAFTLPEAVRMLTLAPATAWGFSDRGLVREGFAADLNVFDPDTIAPLMPTVAADLPTGAKRLVQGATGMLATVVGGEVVLRNGEATGARPGRLLRTAVN